MEMFASCVLPTTSPMNTLVRATPTIAATYGIRRRMARSRILDRAGFRHAWHGESRGNAGERRGVARDRVGQERPHERAERRDGARAAGVHDLPDRAGLESGVADHLVDERGGLVEERRDEPLEAAAHDPRVHVDRGVVVREDRARLRRELALGGIRGLEDLVAELQLNRDPEAREPAPG